MGPFAAGSLICSHSGGLIRALKGPLCTKGLGQAPPRAHRSPTARPRAASGGLRTSCASWRGCGTGSSASPGPRGWVWLGGAWVGGLGWVGLGFLRFGAEMAPGVQIPEAGQGSGEKGRRARLLHETLLDLEDNSLLVLSRE